MDPDLPVFHGLIVYRHLRHRFSLLYPEGWPQQHLDERDGGGVAFSPNPDEPATYMLVQSHRLRVRVRPDDLDTLHEGFLDGLRQLPDLQIESEEAHAVDPLIDLQARHTYRDGDATRKRWIRVLYQDRVQISLIAQGASVAAFDYWLPMFNMIMRTVQFADWWAEATGTSWRRSLGDSGRRRGGRGEDLAPPADQTEDEGRRTEP